MRFVDTNVLLYSVSTARDEAAKAEVARRILQAEDLGLSVQVLQEFHVQATRSGRRHALTFDQSHALIEAWLRFPVQEMTLAVMRAAIMLIGLLAQSANAGRSGSGFGGGGSGGSVRDHRSGSDSSTVFEERHWRRPGIQIYGAYGHKRQIVALSYKGYRTQ